jgi:hypothetical protein
MVVVDVGASAAVSVGAAVSVSPGVGVIVGKPIAIDGGLVGVAIGRAGAWDVGTHALDASAPIRRAKIARAQRIGIRILLPPLLSSTYYHTLHLVARLSSLVD